MFLSYVKNSLVLTYTSPNIFHQTMPVDSWMTPDFEWNNAQNILLLWRKVTLNNLSPVRVHFEHKVTRVNHSRLLYEDLSRYKYPGQFFTRFKIVGISNIRVLKGSPDIWLQFYSAIHANPFLICPNCCHFFCTRMISLLRMFMCVLGCWCFISWYFVSFRFSSFLLTGEPCVIDSLQNVSVW